MARLFIYKHKNLRLLIDPWLTGSCYWRSWWNYPEPPAEILQSLESTHIYITHLHWDQYHGATFFSASKLLRIHPRGDAVDYKRFFTLVDLYENDGLPLWRIFESRQLIHRLRRFRKFLDLFWYVHIIRLRQASLSNVWAGEQKRLHP